MARREVAALPDFTLLQATLPAELPRGSWDLVVMGEIGYFLDSAALDTLAEAIVPRLAQGGELLAVHWRHPGDMPSDGDAVHERLRRLSLSRLVRHTEPDFHLEAWRA